MKQIYTKEIICHKIKRVIAELDEKNGWEGHNDKRLGNYAEAIGNIEALIDLVEEDMIEI